MGSFQHLHKASFAVPSESSSLYFICLYVKQPEIIMYFTISFNTDTLYFQPRPAEVLVEGKSCELIRQPDSFESLLTPYLSPKNCSEETKKQQHFLQNQWGSACEID